LAELAKVNAKEKNSLDFFRRLSNSLLNVDSFYLDAEIEEKRGIVDAIYPQKLEIGKGAYRTPKVNDGADLIYLINSKSQGVKKGTEMDFPLCPLG
jgi:hypothetical protein